MGANLIGLVIWASNDGRSCSGTDGKSGHLLPCGFVHQPHVLRDHDVSTERAELSILEILNGSPSGLQSQLPDAPCWEDFKGTRSLYWACIDMGTVFLMLIPDRETIRVSEHQELVSQGSDAVLEDKPTAWPS